MILFNYFKAGYYCTVYDTDIKIKSLAKFDTGASKTLVSINSLNSRLVTKEFIEYLKAGIQRRKIVASELIAANNGIIEVYPCFMNNVSLGQYIVHKFYCWICLDDISNQKFLIGDDFISCCEDFNEIYS